MSEAYSTLAEWFEYLNADCDYEKWSQYLYARLLESGIDRGKGMDIGCGSGVFTRALAKCGYDMTGYDVSAAMLSKAEQLGTGSRVRYVLSDARSIEVLGGKADFAVCVNDCLNYIPPRDVKKVMKRAASCLRKGGVFLFDVSSAYKLREILGNNTFCEDREELAYLWFNELKRDRIEMDLTVFIKGKDGRFDRSDEHHTQYIHERSDLEKAAAEAGFSVKKVEGEKGDAEDRTRLNFICVRE